MPHTPLLRCAPCSLHCLSRGDPEAAELLAEFSQRFAGGDGGLGSGAPSAAHAVARRMHVLRALLADVQDTAMAKRSPDASPQHSGFVANGANAHLRARSVHDAPMPGLAPFRRAYTVEPTAPRTPIASLVGGSSKLPRPQLPRSPQLAGPTPELAVQPYLPSPERKVLPKCVRSAAACWSSGGQSPAAPGGRPWPDSPPTLARLVPCTTQPSSTPIRPAPDITTRRELALLAVRGMGALTGQLQALAAQHGTLQQQVAQLQERVLSCRCLEAV